MLFLSSRKLQGKGSGADGEGLGFRVVVFSKVGPSVSTQVLPSDPKRAMLQGCPGGPNYQPMVNTNNLHDPDNPKHWGIIGVECRTVMQDN